MVIEDVLPGYYFRTSLPPISYLGYSFVSLQIIWPIWYEPYYMGNTSMLLLYEQYIILYIACWTCILDGNKSFLEWSKSQMKIKRWKEGWAKNGMKMNKLQNSLKNDSHPILDQIPSCLNIFQSCYRMLQIRLNAYMHTCLQILPIILGCEAWPWT